MLGMGQSVGFLGLVGMLGGLMNGSSTGNMAIASATGKAWLQAINKYIIAEIDKRVTTSNKGIGTKYNGIDVQQTQNYIKLHCESYIEKILLSHGWSEPSSSESMHHDIMPISPDTVSCLQNLVGPIVDTKEHLEIRKKGKFSYQGLHAELIYAYIVVHIEIGNAIQFLSKFSSSPHMEHYMALKNICKYLCKHKSEGLIYWCTQPLNILPEIPFKSSMLTQFYLHSQYMI